LLANYKLRLLAEKEAGALIGKNKKIRDAK